LHGDLRKATLATRPHDPRTNAFLSMDELKTAISETKNTAPGHEQLCHEMLSICPTTVLKPFSFFFQQYLLHRRSPTILAALHRHSNLQTWQTFQPPFLV